MRRSELPSGRIGLDLIVDNDRTAGLRFEVASGRRILLRQRDRTVLFARVDPNKYGVHVYRTSAYRSPIPAPRADHARRLATSGTASAPWWGRWAHRFAGWLDQADNGPLHSGRWLLQPRMLPPYCLHDDLVVDHPAAYLDWSPGGWNGVVPLRPLPDPDVPRVKAYRRQARENILAPLLVWEVSVFDGYVLLDGHHRLVAAQAERIEPAVLVLTTAVDLREEQEWRDAILARHEAMMEQLQPRAAKQQSGTQQQADRLVREFAAQCAGPPDASRTRAWPLPGGAAAWDTDAARQAPGWSAVGRGEHQH